MTELTDTDIAAIIKAERVPLLAEIERLQAIFKKIIVIVDEYAKKHNEVGLGAYEACYKVQTLSRSALEQKAGGE